MKVGHWALFEREEIPDIDTGEKYLSRVKLVSTPWFGVYLHHIRKPDWSRDPHDHPWNFTSVVLRGGYVEIVAAEPVRGRPVIVGTGKQWRPGTLHCMVRGEYHAIVHVKPNTWTLVFTGRFQGSWGFLTAEGHVQWQDYIAQHQRSAA